MTDLDNKINKHFQGLVVRKDLVKKVKGNAIVPSYVLEYLLGQYCATNDENSIESGLETVKEILSKHYVHRNEANLIKSNIRERGRYKIIDKVSVALNDKSNTYEATFSNLGIKKVLIDTNTIKKHPKLLVSGVWCISEIEFEHNEDSSIIPWILASIKPIQISKFDFEAYSQSREHFSTEEWIDLLIQSIGFNPDMFGKRNKMLQLLRLIPFVERNYNLIELGPKGTGKSHIFSEFSPHGMLVSGGEVTVPKLFANNLTGKLGLVGYWDVVAFDEFAGKKKKVDKSLVDILKNYLANKTFSRGVETLGADASMAFVGNTKHNVPHMLKYSNFFEELPDKYYDPAFIDRLHAFIPGWEIGTIRGDMFSNGYGFVVDYIAEILRHQRNFDFSGKFQKQNKLSSDIATRDKDAIHKTFSGFMKILFPNNKQTLEETEEVLEFSIECRKRVKDQLLRIDNTFDKVNFSYTTSTGKVKEIRTLEEIEYPNFYYKNENFKNFDEDSKTKEKKEKDSKSNKKTNVSESKLEEPNIGNIIISENQTGISYYKLFGAYIKNAKKITITDPYIRIFHQIRNLMEFIETVIKIKKKEDEIDLHLITQKDEMRSNQQEDYFIEIQKSTKDNGINFTWEYDHTNTIHARHILLDNGWKISIDRGLDIFQRYDMNDTFNVNNRLQETRRCKSSEIIYFKIKTNTNKKKSEIEKYVDLDESITHEFKSSFNIPYPNMPKSNLENGRKVYKLGNKPFYSEKEIISFIQTQCLKTIVAFLNSRGGNLVIGVSENNNKKEIVGINNDNYESDDKFLRIITQEVNNRVGMLFSQKYVTVSIHEINFKKLCLVNVKEYIPEKNQTPALLDKKHLYVRTGNRTDEILGIDKIAEFTANRIK